MAIVFRQEIYVSLITKIPIELTGADCGIEDSLAPASDSTWLCRMMSHTAKITNYAYSGQPRTEALWDQYWHYLEEWDAAKPASFCPLNDIGLGWRDEDMPRCNREQATGSGTFPQIYYSHDFAGSAQQYAEICKVLLLAHDPRMPGLGFGRAQFIQAQEEKIRTAVRRVCGIWLSNPEFILNRVPACLAIAMTGELFTCASEAERRQLLDIITQAEAHLGWPCLRVGPRLISIWDGGNVHSEYGRAIDKK